jgi:hypothetical protein
VKAPLIQINAWLCSAGEGGRRERALRSYRRGFWHANCFITGMAYEKYLLVLFQIVCLLMFSCGAVVLAQHPEWFGV